MTPDFLRYLADFTNREKVRVTVRDLKELLKKAEQEFSDPSLSLEDGVISSGLPQSLVELNEVIQSLPADENQAISPELTKEISAINARRLARLESTSLRSSKHDTQALFDALLSSASIHNTTQPTLADEVWLNVLRYMSPGDVSNFARVSKFASRLANDPLLWRQLYQQATGKKYIPTAALPSAQPLLLEMLNNTWRSLFAHPVLNPQSSQNTNYLTRFFPHGRQSLKTILSSPAPEGKGLVLLMQILSYQDIMKDYPEPARTLFSSFLADVTTNFSLHDESTQATLALRYQRLLLILEYAYLKKSGSLPENFPHNDESLSSQFLMLIKSKDSNNPFWDSFNTLLEEINTEKLIRTIVKANLVILTEGEFFTLSAEQILLGADQNLSVLSPENRELQLSNCNFSRLPQAIKYLTALEELDLSSNQLTSLPQQIGKLSALRKLRVFNNQLTSLPPQIGDLTNLQNFDLSKNMLTSLPEEIGRLSQLETLMLRKNRLTTLPREIGNLRQLKILYISVNQLVSLPQEIAQLASLQILNFAKNPHLVIPINLKSFLNSQTITVSGTDNITWLKNCSQKDIDEAFKKGIDLNQSTALSSTEMTMQKQLIASLFKGEITTKTLGLLDTIAKSEPSYPVLTKQLFNVLAPVLLDNTNQRPVKLQTVVTAIRMVENNMPSPDAGNSNRLR